MLRTSACDEIDPYHFLVELAARMPLSPQDEIDCYLLTGDHDSLFRAWPGDNFMARANHGDTALRAALTARVRERTSHWEFPTVIAGVDLAALTRTKVTPMVYGLFPSNEQETVLDMLERSVVVLTPAAIENLIARGIYLSAAWRLAEMYLVSRGAEGLSQVAARIVGFSEGTTCYLTLDYFVRNSHFDDYLVHEAAHVFHNCERATIGLKETRRREWLQDINFRQRETFAYACEAYSRILELGADPRSRRILLGELEGGPLPGDDRVDVDEYLDILREAIGVRNGWKRIRERCAPVRRRAVIEAGEVNFNEAHG